MKIIVLIRFTLDWSKMGGIESTQAYLMDEMTRRDDVEIQLITSHPDVAEMQVRYRGPVRITYVPRARLGRMNLYRGDIARIRDLIQAEKPDIIHAHGTGLYAGAALASGIPAVVTVHGIMYRELRYYRGLPVIVRGVWDALYERYCLRRTKYLIAIASYVQREFAGMTRARVWNVPSAISNAFFDVTRAPRPHTILFPGVVAPRKAVDELLSAIAIVRRTLPDVRLRIAGETVSYPDYVAGLHRFVAQNGMESNVEFLGVLPEEAMLSEYGQAAALALSSHQETLPAVIEQAMAARVPVVSTAVGGVPDVVVHERTGLLVQPGDVEGLAAELLRVLTNQGLAGSLAAQARQYAEENFRASAVAQKLLNVYQTIRESEGRA